MAHRPGKKSDSPARAGDLRKKCSPSEQDRLHHVKVLGRSELLPVSGTRDQKVATIAAAQRGRVVRRQLLAAAITSGMIGRMRAGGFLHPLHAGVYGVGHTAEVELGAETAALLAAGDLAILSHESAAVLWRLVRWVSDARIHVTLFRGDRRRSGLCIHQSRTVLPRDIAIHRGLPVTSPARTILDLAGSLRPRELELALDEGLRNEIVTLAQVADVVDRVPNRPGEAVLKALLAPERNDTVTHSEGEERLLALVRAADLPPPELNQRLAGYEVDFLWRRERVVVECDGYKYHGSRRRFEDDRRKDAVLSAAGFRVIRVTWVQMRDEPYAVIVRVAQALARAGAGEAA